MRFAGITLSCADVSIPELGVWTARVRLAEDATLSKGQSGTLEIGGLALEGTVVEGGPFVGLADYLIVGGAGGWRQRVVERPYRVDNGVRRAMVADDLAELVGEEVEIAAEQDGVLGYAWTRAAGLASDALELLGAPWFVRADGVTVLGSRDGGTVAAELSVRSYDPTRRTALLGLADDEDLDGIVPGLSIDADGVALRIEHVRIVALPASLHVEVGPHPERQLLDALTARIEARMRYFGVWPYQVDEQNGTRLTVRAEPLTAAAGLPGLSTIDVAHGLGGTGETYAAGAVVLVGFRGGSPAEPYVAHAVTGTPSRVAVEASEKVEVKAPLVLVGDAEHKRVAREGDTVRVDPRLGPGPAVEAGGVMYNPMTQSLVVVGPGNPAAVYFPGVVARGSDVLKTQ